MQPTDQLIVVDAFLVLGADIPRIDVVLLILIGHFQTVYLLLDLLRHCGDELLSLVFQLRSRTFSTNALQSTARSHPALLFIKSFKLLNVASGLSPVYLHITHAALPRPRSGVALRCCKSLPEESRQNARCPLTQRNLTFSTVQRTGGSEWSKNVFASEVRLG